jgi:hypothetical protein
MPAQRGKKTEKFYIPYFFPVIYRGESQMRKSDEAKKIFGLILVPLIRSDLSRRFKGKLGENKKVVNYYEC